MGASCRSILLILSVWFWSACLRSSPGQTFKENWHSRQSYNHQNACKHVDGKPITCCNNKDFYGICIANMTVNCDRSAMDQWNGWIPDTSPGRRRHHENKMGKASKRKTKKELKMMKILKTKKVEGIRSEKDKRMQKEDKQLPKICPGPCVCDFNFAVKMKKLKTKHRVAVRKLYRIQAWWKLLKFGKQKKAAGTPASPPTAAIPPTFSIPFGYLSLATSGATTCGCSSNGIGAASLANHPNGSEIQTIYDQLENCTRTATWACSTEDITLTKDMDKNVCKNFSASVCVQSLTGCGENNNTKLCPDCDASVCVQPVSDCAANKSYITSSITSCIPRWQNFTLTQAMVTHIRDVCLPQLNAWISRYRSCGSCKTYGDCVYSCQTDQDLYNCQSRTCDIDKSCLKTNDCSFETCLRKRIDAGLDNSDCKCDCYKALEYVGPGAQFPINQTKVDCMDCYEMQSFERLVFTRRNRCLNPGGITAANNDGLGVALQDYPGGPFPMVPGLTPSGALAGDRLSGNFVDCRFQGRQAFEWIYKCREPCCTSTSSSTILSATTFSTSTSTSSTATTTATISTPTITSTATATSTSTTTSKTITASTATTTKTSTTSSTSTTTATISTTTSTTQPTNTTTTTTTATISTTTSITITTSTPTSTTTSTTTMTTTTTTTSITTPTTTTTTTTSTATTTTTT